MDLGATVNGGNDNDCNESRLSPDGRMLYFGSDRRSHVVWPRTRAQAEADLARTAAWDNGNMNIWSVSLEPWLGVLKKRN